MHRISTPEAIAGYWKALEAWRIAARKRAALSAKLPADLKRSPRVMYGYGVGPEGRTPMFAESEREIRKVIDQLKGISLLGAIDAPSRKRIRARLDRRAQRLKRELAADEQALMAAWTEAGWMQALKSERICAYRVYKALDKIRYSHVGSSHEALAVIEFVAKVVDHARRSTNKKAPLGLSENMTTALLRKAGAYLSGEAQDSLKEAA